MRRSLMASAAVVAAAVVSAVPAAAQGRGRRGVVPPGQRPPAGLCRVWVDGLPPGRQPGVTDCAYARTHVPPGGRVLYGGPAPRRAYALNRSTAPYYYGTKPIAGATPLDPRAAYTVRRRANPWLTGPRGEDRDADERAGKGKWKHEAGKDAKREWKRERKGDGDHGHGKQDD